MTEQWAEHLSTPVGAAPEVALAAFLRALPGDNFFPPPERAIAVNALAGASVPVGKDGGVEQMLRADVEAFAARFWTLEPAERLLAWSELVRSSAPVARLRGLEPGLDVSAAPLGDPDAEELAALMRALFVLPPRDRAIRRNTWLAERAADADRWQAAFAAVLRTAPGLAALDRQLWIALDPSLTPAVIAEPAAPSRSEVSDDVADFAVRMRVHETVTARRRAKQEQKQPKQNSTRIGYGVVFGILLLIRFLAGLHSSSSAPTGSPPSYTPPSSAPTNRTFTAAEVAEFEQYERNEGTHARPPPNYGTWLRAGRPRGTPVGKEAAAPDRTAFTLDRLQIVECQRYDRTRTGAKPLRYDLWVKAGKPIEPGTYPFPDPKP